MSDDPRVLASRLLQRAWNRDGLPEIAIGLFFLMVGGLAYWEQVLTPHTAGHTAVVLTMSGGIPVFCLTIQNLLKRSRRRYMVPRYGYVEELSIPRRTYWLGLAMVAILLPAFWLAGQAAERFVLPVTGLLGGGISVKVGWSGRMARFCVGGVLMMATGAALALLQVPLTAGMALLFASQGLFYALSGSVVLVTFLLQSGDPQDE